MMHPQVWVESPFQGAYVDSGIQGLLKQLWEDGVHTMYSCEGNRSNDDGPYVVVRAHDVGKALLILQECGWKHVWVDFYTPTAPKELWAALRKQPRNFHAQEGGCA